MPTKSSGSLVLVDDAAEESGSPYRTVELHDGGVGVGWVLVEALVWTVVVEVSLVLGKDAAGVTFVVDEYLVGALGADTPDEPFRVAVARGVRGGIFTLSIPAEANTASKVAVNFASRSRIRNRNRDS